MSGPTEQCPEFNFPRTRQCKSQRAQSKLKTPAAVDVSVELLRCARWEAMVGTRHLRWCLAALDVATATDRDGVRWMSMKPPRCTCASLASSTSWSLFKRRTVCCTCVVGQGGSRQLASNILVQSRTMCAFCCSLRISSSHTQRSAVSHFAFVSFSSLAHSEAYKHDETIDGVTAVWPRPNERRQATRTITERR